MKNWVCPTCGIHATLAKADVHSGEIHLTTSTGMAAGEGFYVAAHLTRCPNTECARPVLLVLANWGSPESSHYGNRVQPDDARPAGIGAFQFLPTTAAPLSPHVPRSVAEDYSEAFLIRSLSPKAAAALARRALQGMVRNYWGVSKRTLADELNAIEARCDPELFAAMMVVKAVGNIGAHPERDVNLIVEIVPGEVDQLLDLIHLLDAEWYIARANKAARLARVKMIGQAKADARADGKSPSEGA